MRAQPEVQPLSDAAKQQPKLTAVAGDTERPAKYGIKAKLLLAFCSLAGLTAIASGVAWYVFGEIDHAVTRVMVESVPGTLTALSLAEKSSQMAATAPALMASDSQEERALEQAKLDERARALVSLIGDLKASNVAPERTTALSSIEQKITAKLQELNVAVEKRLRLKAQRQAAVGKLSKAQTDFVKALEPLVDNSVWNLVMRSERVTAKSASAITGLVDGGVSKLDHLLTINAEVNLAAGLLAEAAHVDDPVLIEPIRERFVAATATIDRNLRQLPGGPRATKLRKRAEALVAFGASTNNIFDSRKRTLLAASDVGRPPHADNKQLAAIKTAQESLLLTLTPMIDDAAFNLVLTTGKVTADDKKAVTELINVGANQLQLLLMLRAEGNLVADLLDQAAGSTDVNALEPLKERFVAAKDHIDEKLRGLPASLNKQLQKVASTLIGLGRGNDGMFALRRAELQQIAAAQAALRGSRALADQLGEEVAGLVTAARAATNTATSRSASAINSAKIFLILITVAGIAGAVIVTLYYVVPWIIRPLERITHAMTDLAAGDTSVDIPGRERTDELGRMAQALGVFRDTAIEVQKSNLKEIRETRRRLSEAIESISEAFSLYDSDDRLVLGNYKFAEVFDHGAGPPRPGMTFEEIIRSAVERGLIEDAKNRSGGWLRQRLAQHRNPTEPLLEHRADGTWLQISERRTADGGSVAVYSDLTEIKESEQRAAAANQLILQSLRYARRIQSAILPASEDLTSVTADHFLIWEPRDIVGGDFFWFQRINDGYAIIVGDCTGHGVPGAFMTLITWGMLDRMLTRSESSNPSEVLAGLHRGVQSLLGQDQDSGETDDGLEAGVCFIYPSKQEMTFAGARFSLWKASQTDVIEIKGDRKGLGYRRYPQETTFTDFRLPLDVKDAFYLTTDGLIDQIGGPRGRSFGKRRFQTLLKRNQGAPMRKQAESLKKSFKKFQGQQPRRDDLTVLGFVPLG